MLGVAISTSFPRFFHGGLYHFVRVHVDTSRPNNTSEVFVPISFRLPLITFNQTWTTRAPLNTNLNHTNSTDELLFFDETDSLEKNTQDLDNFMNYTAAQLDSFYEIVDSFKQKIQDPWVHFREKGDIFNTVNGTLENVTNTNKTVGSLEHNTENLHNNVNHTSKQMDSVYEMVDSIKQKIQDPWVHFINRGNIFKLDNETINNATSIEASTVGLNRTFDKALTLIKKVEKIVLNINNTTSTARTESVDTQANELINETDELIKRIKKEPQSEHTSKDLKRRIYRDIKEFCNINAITSEYCQIMMVNDSVEVIPIVNVTRKTKEAVPVVNLTNDTRFLRNLTEGNKSLINLAKEINPTDGNFKEFFSTENKTDEKWYIQNLNNETTKTLNLTQETTTFVNKTEDSAPINLTRKTPPVIILTKETTDLFHLTNDTNLVKLSKEINSNNSTLIFKPTLLKRIKRVTNTDQANITNSTNNTITTQNGTKYENQELLIKNENQSTMVKSVVDLSIQAANTTNTLNTSSSKPDNEKLNINTTTKNENLVGKATLHDFSLAVANTFNASFPQPSNENENLNTSTLPKVNNTEAISLLSFKIDNTFNTIKQDKIINTTEPDSTLHTTEPDKSITSKTLPVEENGKENLTTYKAENSSETSLTLEGDTTNSNKVYKITETTARTNDVFEVPNGMDEDESAYNTYGTSPEPKTQGNEKQEVALKKLDPSVPTNNNADYNASEEINKHYANGDVMRALVIPIFLVVLMGSVLFAMHNMSRYFVQRTNNNRQNNEERPPPGGTDVIQLNVIVDNPNETIASNGTTVKEETGNTNQTLQEIA